MRFFESPDDVGKQLLLKMTVPCPAHPLDSGLEAPPPFLCDIVKARICEVVCCPLLRGPPVPPH